MPLQYTQLPPPPPPERSFTNDIEAQRVIDRKGIVGARIGESNITDTAITSDTGFINVFLTGVYPEAATHIYSVIEDFEGKKVSLKISDLNPNIEKKERGVLWLRGDRSNTFTGGVYVMDSNILALSKDRGATSVRGNIFASNGGAICIDKSDQISDSSTVILDGSKKAVEFYFNGYQGGMRESFHQMVIKGKGELRFFSKNSNSNDRRKLYLDDLFIEEGALLRVLVWLEGKALLLVRKDSEHLSESLKRIVFDNDKTKEAGLREYDKDYWEIGPGFPEPASYGAILVGVVGFVVKRRRKVSRIS